MAARSTPVKRSMKVVVLREAPGEPRSALTPPTVEKLTRLGLDVHIESGVGIGNGYPDHSFEQAGGVVAPAGGDALEGADIVLNVNKPSLQAIEKLRRGALHISFLDPFNSPDTVRALADSGVSAFCMELIPRTTYAQKMDALSSQASLAGYAAVVLAAQRVDKALPMMSTPAGTIAPARVFVVGAGVAGLQAIATAKRLGAVVEAYDTRPAVAEQVRSLGAKFVDIDVGDTGQDEQGYAKPLTAEQLELQRRQMARSCANADIVITTAQVFGKPAPRIISADMVAAMRPGSVIVDMAASTGGNVEGSAVDQEVSVGGVSIVGLANFPGQVARDASQMYAANVAALLEHLWDQDARQLKLDTSDPIVDSALLTHQGEIRHPDIQRLAA